MKLLKTGLLSLGITVVIVFGIAVVTELLLMFTTSSGDAYRVGFFNTFFFKTATNASGNINMSIGVASVTGLTVTILVVFVLTFLTIFMYRFLVNYRGRLINQKSGLG